MSAQPTEQAASLSSSSSSPSTSDVKASQEDPGAFIGRIMQYLAGGFTMFSIHVGSKLGLYKALSELGPCTAQQLAEKTGYHFRWVQEWLFLQAANQLIVHDGNEIFRMTPVQTRALVQDANAPEFVGGTATALKAVSHSIDRTIDAFKTGVGCKYDDHGCEMAHAISELQGPWFQHHLVNTLCTVPGVQAKLEAGTKFGDVGCGVGEAILILAQKFPKSEFHGYDISEHALSIAQEKLAACGLTNVHFHNATDAKQRLPEDASFSVIMNIDAIHDMADPLPVVRAIGKSLTKDGVWISSEPVSCGSLANNLSHPLAPMMSGFSLFVCMSSAMSEPNANGFGTMGLSKDKFSKLCAQGNLEIVNAREGGALGTPMNIIYEIRPKSV